MEAPAVSYDPAYFDSLLKAEEKHFWFRARNEILRKVIAGVADRLPTDARVFEVGCGNGNVTRVLVDVFGPDRVTAMEAHREGVDAASRRLSCTVVQGELTSAPVEGPFGMIGMFDVLEHIEDERGALDAVHALLGPGGFLLVTVPAHRSLWSYFDEEAGHFRRYEVAELESALTRSGFEVEYATELFSLLFPAMWVGRRLSALRKKKTAREKTLGEVRTIPVVNEVLAWLLAREAIAVGKKKKIPFGTSVMALARRKV